MRKTINLAVIGLMLFVLAALAVLSTTMQPAHAQETATVDIIDATTTPTGSKFLITDPELDLTCVVHTDGATWGSCFTGIAVPHTADEVDVMTYFTTIILADSHICFHKEEADGTEWGDCMPTDNLSMDGLGKIYNGLVVGGE